MKEYSKKFNNVDIKFRFRFQKKDTNHLLIIFSGYGGGATSYDALNLFSHSRSAILWIKDDFYNDSAYYLCKEMDFSIEKSVYELILYKLKSLGFSKNDCTLYGSSKGGTAALFFGIKYNFENIVSSIPQSKIGSYLSGNKPSNPVPMKNAEFIMGNINAEKIDFLDSLLFNLIKKDNSTRRNIYIITSESDEQYQDHILPLNKAISEKNYSNYNLIEAKSLFIEKHTDVSGYCVHVILSIVYQLSLGIIPCFLQRKIIGDNYDRSIKQILQPICNIEGFIVNSNGSLKLNGYGFFRGMSLQNKDILKYKLIFKSDLHIKEFKLTPFYNESLSKRFYFRSYINYDYGSFSINNEINLHDFVSGEYSIHIEMYNHEINNIIDMIISQNIIENFSKNVKFKFDESGTKLIVN